MHPLMIPIGLGVALIGLFWPEEVNKDEQVSENGRKRRSSDNADKSVSAAPASDSGSRIVKPKPKPKRKEPDNAEIPADNETTLDLRHDSAGDSGGRESDPAQGTGQAEPLTQAETEDKPEDKPDA